MRAVGAARCPSLRGLALGASLLASGCVPLVREAPPQDAASFCAAKARLAALRDTRRTAFKQTVKLTLSAPIMPQPLSARGAIAISPPHDLRMILLGPGGGTALDLWLHDRTFRFAVPAIGRTIRGDEKTPAEKKRGLPVDFLRWWMLDPFGGDVVFARETLRGLEFVLRDRAEDGSSAYVDGRVACDGQVDATRTTWNAIGEKVDEETLHASTIGCGRVDYEQASTRLTVVASCEAQSAGANPRAFVDPDTTGDPR